MQPPSRSALTAIDLVAALFAVSCLAAVLIFQIQESRIKSLAAGCRNNLRQIGVAVAAYVDHYGSLPVAEFAGPPFLVANSPQSVLLSDLLDASAVRYDAARPWFRQESGTGAQSVSAYRCPAAVHADPIDSIAARTTGCALGTVLGTTDYIVCKGPNDAWCLEGNASAIPAKDRGAFEIGRLVRLADISDGLAQTMIVGEGTGDPNWVLSRRNRFPLPAVEAETGQEISAFSFWAWPVINTVNQQQATKAVIASVFGTTGVPLNKHPVIETLADTAQLDSCLPRSKRGPHTCSGFRSNHERGSYFLLADGSARFVAEVIEPHIYRALSTIAGGETVEYVE